MMIPYLSTINLWNNIFKTPRVGFEPTTNRLTADRSTTELSRIAHIKLL